MTTITNEAATGRTITSVDLAGLLLRVTSGIFFFVHGWVKLTVFTPAGTAAYFDSIGLPAFLAYLTIAAEVLGGLALIAGVYTRIVAAAMVPLLLGAAYFGHGGAGFTFSNAGGGWEYPVYWAVAMAALALIGGGAYALKHETR